MLDLPTREAELSQWIDEHGHKTVSEYVSGRSLRFGWLADIILLVAFVVSVVSIMVMFAQ